MNDNLQNIQLYFRCPVKWDEMETINGTTRYCSYCAKQVHDFTDAKQAEFMRILAENGNSACGRFRAQQVAPAQPAKINLWKKWASAALVFIGINLLHGKASAQTNNSSQTEKKDTSQEIRLDEPVGGCGTPLYDVGPEFPGGTQKLVSFITRHLHYHNAAAQKKAFLEVMVNADGSVGDIRVLRGISPEADAEAIRVLKSLPKWHPATLKGKPVQAHYVVPVSFLPKSTGTR